MNIFDSNLLIGFVYAHTKMCVGEFVNEEEAHNPLLISKFLQSTVFFSSPFFCKETPFISALNRNKVLRMAMYVNFNISIMRIE